ncbi:hypothetical protein XELAEV_18005141mg [Xenopus laevis]|uniref:Uncharacterized protein n=1 Tax=Xenopus laevis TaxID=8355 RepID=A0A974I2Y3_XENLA|nr:hypothetical protein XELAEV_18005141mg [Xenopus laevis]
MVLSSFRLPVPVTCPVTCPVPTLAYNKMVISASSLKYTDAASFLFPLHYTIIHTKNSQKRTQLEHPAASMLFSLS